MRESELHQQIFARSSDLSAKYAHVLVGPGDDCAVVRTSDGGQMLLKVDQLIEGRHFLPGTPVDAIARKAIARAISDIASMAGRPMWSLVSVILPPEFSKAGELAAAVDHWGRFFGAPVVGGDVAAGSPGAALSLNVTVGGVPAPGRGPVLRSTARPGDELWVTGRIGGSFSSGRHLTFSPRVAQGAWLADTLVSDLHAMIDISDGLGRDAGRIAERSGVRIEIEGASVPLNVDAGTTEQALNEGEDYELLFAASPGVMSTAIAGWKWKDVTCTRIGRVLQGTGCELASADGRRQDASAMGWDH